MSAPGKPITAWHITSADNLGGILTDGFTARVRELLFG